MHQVDANIQYQLTYELENLYIRLKVSSSASKTFYADQIKKERLDMQRQKAGDVDSMTPEMREKEEELYLKKLDEEWRA